MKIVFLIVLAGCVGGAMADPIVGTGGGYASSDGTAFGWSTSTIASLESIDVSGIFSYHEKGDELNVTMDIFLGANEHVTGIGWDVALEAFDPSWLFEMRVSVTSTTGDGVTVVPGDGDSFSGGPFDYSSGGIIDLTSQGLDFNLNADGILRLEFYEFFDDEFIDPDGIWHSGSISVEHVPAPASLSLLCLGGLAAARRRR